MARKNNHARRQPKKPCQCPQNSEAEAPNTDRLRQIPVWQYKAADTRDTDNNQRCRGNKARIHSRRSHHDAADCGHGLTHRLRQMDSGLLQKLKGHQQAQHLRRCGGTARLLSMMERKSGSGIIS